MDYRVIVRNFEVERMFATEGVDRDIFGSRYERMLTKKTREHNLFESDYLSDDFPKSFQSLYVLYMFDMEVCNGGISQFFHNSEPELIEAVSEILEYIGASEMKNQYEPLLKIASSYTFNEALQYIDSWKEYTDFIKSQGYPFDTFDSWYFENVFQKMDLYMQKHIKNNMDEFMIICDGDRKLETVWHRNILDELMKQYKMYLHQEKFEDMIKDALPEEEFSLPHYEGLFTPKSRKSLSKNRDKQSETGKIIFNSLFKSIETAHKNPSRIIFRETPNPSIHIPESGIFTKRKPVTIEYYEDKLIMAWGVVL